MPSKAATTSGKSVHKTQFLGSGTYGCVFTPPLPCSDDMKKSMLSNNPNNVGKTYFQDRDFLEERALLKHITYNVDPKGEFTVQFLGDCQIQEPNEHDLAEASQECQQLYGTKAQQVIYPNGGVDVKWYYNKYRQNPTKFFVLLKAFPSIFKGLEILKEKGLVHNDIKPANMLFNQKKAKVLLIDYGMMSTFKDVYRNYNATHDAVYMYYPPEYRIFNKLLDGMSVPTMGSMMEFYKNAFAPMDVVTFFAAFDVDLTADITNVLHTSNNIALSKTSSSTSPQRRSTRKLSTTLNATLDKIDVYSLGISLGYIMHSMKLLDADVINGLSKINRLQCIAVKQLIHHMIRPNVFERWNTTRVARAAIQLLAL